MDVTVRPALTSDIPELGRVLGIAFADDPVMTWSIPDATSRPRRAAIAFATLTRLQFIQHGGVEVAEDDTGAIVGAAVWAPPGQWHTSNATILRAMPHLVRAFGLRTPRAARMSDRMAAAHPRDPHWYLAFIGTLPTARGRGYGRALMSSRLDRCDAEGVPAYLESSKPDNVPYYERFGFEKTGDLDVTKGGPLMWPMWRTPISK
ncbi:GNAT family N-acetyltransferase [Nocardia uniformis]|uniref:GNAT family N-acetyltransferase n=1 Tax=Nocardia uniformis TaxID=53432 RepID=A0A849BVC4_9NOCA|nr:GNAT family N-acetyltransferase [Nocardia uniformis]NNH68876.1 GNAT family N-acetyltransferase [Nocardia uniformis]